MALFSKAIQDYLKVIYKIRRRTGRVNTSALAQEMGVSPASATNMVKKLARRGLRAGDLTDPATAARFAAYRRELHDERLTLRALGEQEGIVCAPPCGLVDKVREEFGNVTVARGRQRAVQRE